jgi:hypothetical protein
MSYGGELCPFGARIAQSHARLNLNAANKWYFAILNLHAQRVAFLSVNLMPEIDVFRNGL